MPRTKAPPPKPRGKKSKSSQVEGLHPLDSVAPNDWNMNELPAHKYESLLHNLKEEGWVRSQPLLVWGSDEKGRAKNVIINGEHRWKAAQELGFREGPMVILHGISRAKAIELTIKLDNTRGEFDKAELNTLLRNFLPAAKLPNAALSLGFTQPELNKVFALPAIRLDGGATPAAGEEGGKAKPAVVTSRNNASKQVPLYLGGDQRELVPARLEALMKRWSFNNVTDVVLRCVAECAGVKS